MKIRVMIPEDYDKVYELWKSVKGLGIRSLDDSKEGIERFLKRNPGLSMVAESKDKIVGTILCGHDGRRGCFYHVCVDESFRNKGIGSSMAKAAQEALKKEHINKVSLIAFSKNELGNAFWKKEEWTIREDLNYYDLTLNEDNQTAFNQ